MNGRRESKARGGEREERGKEMKKRERKERERKEKRKRKGKKKEEKRKEKRRKEVHVKQRTVETHGTPGQTPHAVPNASFCPSRGKNQRLTGHRV